MNTGTISPVSAGTDDSSEGPVADSRRWSRSDWVWVAVAVGIAFLVRLVYLWQLRSSPYFAHEIMDARIHDAWAKQIAAGQPWADGAYFRAPLYIWFLGWLYRLTGTDSFLVRLVQMGIGSLSCGLVYVLGRWPFGRTVAGVAALACSISWVLVFFDGELLIAGTAAFLNLLLLLALMRASRRATPWVCVASGLLLGLSALARPNVLLFAPFVVAWLLFFHPALRGGVRERWVAGLRPALLFGFGAVVVVAPVTVRNWVAGGDRVLIASQAGVNLYIGNHAESDGMHVYIPGLTLTTDDIYRGSAELAERETGRSLKPSEVSRHYFAKARGWWAEHPGDALALLFRKTGLFWSWREILNNKDLYVLTERYTPVARFLPIGFWIVGPLGLVGLLACLGRGRELFPLWGFVLVYMASIVLFFVTARFRVPVLPPLTLLAAYGGCELWQGLRLTPRGRGPRLFVALVLSGVLVFAVVPPRRVSRAVELGKLGAVLLLQERDEEAISILEEAVAEDSETTQARMTLGLAYERADRESEALDAYRAALERQPDYLPALRAAGLLEQRLGRNADAAAHLRRAAALAPEDRTVEAALGRVLPKAGLYAEAVALLERKLSARPDDVEGWTRLTLLRSGSPPDDVRDCEGALGAGREAVRRSARRNALALDALAAAQAECGDFDAALSTASSAMQLARQQGDHATARQIAERYRLFLVGRPWRMND